MDTEQIFSDIFKASSQESERLWIQFTMFRNHFMLFLTSKEQQLKIGDYKSTQALKNIFAKCQQTKIQLDDNFHILKEEYTKEKEHKKYLNNQNAFTALNQKYVFYQSDLGDAQKLLFSASEIANFILSSQGIYLTLLLPIQA